MSGHLVVDPASRQRYLETCVEVVRRARETTRCLDVALSADLLDPGRVNVLERWATRSDLEAFRGDGVGEEQGAMILAADVQEHEVPD